jgi:serine/threonine protein kinase
MNEHEIVDPYKTTPPNPLPEQTPLAEPALWIGRYRVDRVLGKGGFGLVYLAHDEQLQRRVAIKVPHPHLLDRPETVQEYLNEARIVANLDHPHIVSVHDVGSTPEYPFFMVSKLFEGRTLAQKIQDELPGFAEPAELAATIVEALHYAPRKGLVHREVPPWAGGITHYSSSCSTWGTSE